MILLGAGERGEYALVAQCSCSAGSHMVAMNYYEGEGEWYMHLALDPSASWWERVRRAVRFVFRPHSVCRYGFGAEVVLSKRDAEEMLAWLALRIEQMRRVKEEP